MFSGNMPATDGNMSKEIELFKIEIEASNTKHVEPEVLECTSLVVGPSSLHTLENAKLGLRINYGKCTDQPQGRFTVKETSRV